MDTKFSKVDYIINIQNRRICTLQ